MSSASGSDADTAPHPPAAAAPAHTPPADEPTRDDIRVAFEAVRARTMAAEAERRAQGTGPSATQRVNLVAVSKFKSVNCLRDAYECGVRVFGENYVQEIVTKAPQLPPDVAWHFIGHLQSNKARELVHGVPNLAWVETVDTLKLAKKLDAAVASSPRAATPLGIMVQVNTSGEESKSGVSPASGAAAELAAAIVKECPHLRFGGLMTIGMPDYTSKPENFECLCAVREEVAAHLGLAPSDLELSMGMSADYEAAIRMGSTNVRVGSTIFGARPPAKARPA